MVRVMLLILAAFLFGAIVGAVGCFIFMGEDDPGGWDIEELIGPDPYDYVTRRPMTVEPIWAAAAQAWADGRLGVPARAHTVRPESIYEMDPYDYATEGTFDSQVDLWDKR